MGEVRVELDFKPREHQRYAHQLRQAVRFLVLVWHRRAGKTVFAIAELVLEAARCKKPRGRYAYIAPLLKQAKSVAWDYLKAFAVRIPGVSYNETELAVDLPNGARVRLFGADNPDAMRGLYFDGVVMDEVADMKPQVWGGIVRPALADRQGWAIFIGTPKGVNMFSELYHLALKGEDGWAADMKRHSDTGAVSEEEIAQARRTMSPQEFAQEFDCDFNAAVSNTLILLSSVLEALERSIAEHEYLYAPKVLGVDVARYGDDRTVLFPRQGLVAMKPQAFRSLDTMEVAGQVAQYIYKWQPHAVFVDQGGIGAGVLDRLHQLGHPAIGVDFGGRPLDARFENKRAEMWWTLADWVRDGGCLPNVQELPGELTAPTYTYANKRGKLQLESKDEMRARGLPSPDLADALALTFAAPVAVPSALEVASGRGAHAATDYDPYAERD